MRAPPAHQHTLEPRGAVVARGSSAAFREEIQRSRPHRSLTSPQANPWKPSKRYRLLMLVGKLATWLKNKKGK